MKRCCSCTEICGRRVGNRGCGLLGGAAGVPLVMEGLFIGNAGGTGSTGAACTAPVGGAFVALGEQIRGQALKGCERCGHFGQSHSQVLCFEW